MYAVESVRLPADYSGMTTLRSLRIGPRLAAAFGVLGVGLLVVAAVGIQHIGSLKDTSRTIDSTQVPALGLAGHIAQRSTQLGELTAQSVYGEQAAKAEIPSVEADNEADSAKLAKLVKGTPAEGAFADYEKIDGESDALRTKVLASGSRDAYIKQLVPVNHALDASITKLSDAVQADVSGDVARETSAASAGVRLLVVVGAVAMLVAAALAVLITLSVVRPVRAVAERLRALDEDGLTNLTAGLSAAAAGDLTVTATSRTEPLAAGGRDELADLTSTFNSMLAKARESISGYETMRTELSVVIAQVAEGSGTVASASQQMASTSDEAGRAVEEIATAVQEVATGAERQVRMVEESRVAIGEAARVALESDDAARGTAEAADKARAVARDGVAAAQQASDAIRQVADSSAAVGTAIEALSAKSERIGGIVTTITAIAEQTNLLALNAAIEAARAGESGRGFAVVAEEVRKLAEESGKAAGEITQLIGDMQQDTQQVVAVGEQGARRTADGVATVERTRDAFEQIGGAVEDVTARVEQIASAVQQISAQAELVEAGINGVATVAEVSSASAEQVSASTQQTSASAQEMASSAAELAVTAERLDELVSRFKLAR
jgi:methyl-accepting chemotaxis protein